MNRNERETAPRQQSQSPKIGVSMSNTNSILAELPADVKRIREIRLAHGTPAVVETVQTLYPKYDRYIQSRVEHGGETGICLRRDAMRALVGRFSPEPEKRPRSDRRAKPRRVQARLSGAVYTALQRAVARSGMTMQDYLEGMIMAHLNEVRQDNGPGL